MNRKSWWRPINAGTASLRSSTKPGAAAAANLDVTLAGGIALPSKRLGADQPLREQHGHGLAALERHGQRRASGGGQGFPVAGSPRGGGPRPPPPPGRPGPAEKAPTSLPRDR